jgi:hypothetical protein
MSGFSYKGASQIPPVCSDSVDKRYYAWQDLDLELFYQPRDVLDEDAEEASVEVFLCQSL